MVLGVRRADGADAVSRAGRSGAHLVGHTRLAWLLWLAPAALLLSNKCGAQELEPRAYSASPVGINFIGAGYSYSFGSIVFDPTIPITNGHADISAITLGYGRTFGLFGRQFLATIGIPYAWGPLTGDVSGTAHEITRSGFADVRGKLSVNLVGDPALSPKQFFRHPPSQVTVGASVGIQAPTGQYDPAFLINIGTHRWAFKPELGFSWNSHARLYLDFYAGCWFFTDNNDGYPGGVVKTQDPLVSLQAHVSYTIIPRLWAAIDGTWYSGGAAHTNGGPPILPQNNTRLGATVSWGFTRTQSFKAAFVRGTTVRTGTDFTIMSLAYQRVIF